MSLLGEQVRKLSKKDSSNARDQVPIVYQLPFIMGIHQVALPIDFNMP